MMGPQPIANSEQWSKTAPAFLPSRDAPAVRVGLFGQRRHAITNNETKIWVHDRPSPTHQNIKNSPNQIQGTSTREKIAIILRSMSFSLSPQVAQYRTIFFCVCFSLCLCLPIYLCLHLSLSICLSMWKRWNKFINYESFMWQNAEANMDKYGTYTKWVLFLKEIWNSALCSILNHREGHLEVIIRHWEAKWKIAWPYWNMPLLSRRQLRMPRCYQRGQS